MSTPITDVAKVIRSKNSGPFELTMDIIFRERAVYEEVKKRNLINRELVAEARTGSRRSER